MIIKFNDLSVGDMVTFIDYHGMYHRHDEKGDILTDVNFVGVITEIFYDDFQKCIERITVYVDGVAYSVNVYMISSVVKLKSSL